MSEVAPHRLSLLMRLSARVGEALAAQTTRSSAPPRSRVGVGLPLHLDLEFLDFR